MKYIIKSITIYNKGVYPEIMLRADLVDNDGKVLGEKYFHKYNKEMKNGILTIINNIIQDIDSDINMGLFINKNNKKRYDNNSSKKRKKNE